MAFWDIVVGPFELKGPSIKDVRKISGFFDPLPPLSAFFCFSFDPPTPVDVLF